MNKLPHKWPGKAKLAAAMAVMRMDGDRLEQLLATAVVTRMSRKHMKLKYPTIRNIFNTRGKDNG